MAEPINSNWGTTQSGLLRSSAFILRAAERASFSRPVSLNVRLPLLFGIET